MINFVFNVFPISINKLYVNIPGQSRRFVSSEGKAFKAIVEAEVLTTLKNKDSIQYISTLIGKRLGVIIRIKSPSWVLKDGITSRRKDCANGEKALSDSIFKAINSLNIDLDDSQIWDLRIIKELSDTDETIYTIYEYV